MNQYQSIISAIVVLLVAIAGIVGVDVSEEAATQVIGAIVTLAAICWGLWKDHNFTFEAVLGTMYQNQLKAEAKAEEADEDGEL